MISGEKCSCVLRNGIMGSSRINIPKEKLAEYCKSNHIKKLSLFGSVLRDDFRPESDVDVLVVFEEGHLPDLISFSGMELDFDEIVGHKTHLHTAEDLSKYFREEVLRNAVEQYVSRNNMARGV